jgi:hypothetical protein
MNCVDGSVREKGARWSGERARSAVQGRQYTVALGQQNANDWAGMYSGRGGV